MNSALLYSILSGETTYAEWESLRYQLEQTQEPTQDLMSFIDRHRGSFWDKKFFDAALGCRRYDLAAQLIRRIAPQFSCQSGLKPIICPGVFSDQALANMDENKQTARYFFIRLEAVRERLTQEPEIFELERINSLINLLSYFPDKQHSSVKPHI